MSDFQEPQFVLMKGSVKEQVFNLIERSSTATAPNEHIFIKLNALHVNEFDTREGDAGFCAIHMEFLRAGDEGIAREYTHAATVWNKSGDATEKQAQNIAYAIGQCFDGYAKARSSGKTTHILVPPDDLRRPTDPMIPPPHVLTEATLMGGIYPTFMDFLNEHPGSSLPFQLVPAKDPGGLLRGVHVKGDARSTAERAWGLCDGQDLFVNIGDRFLPLERDSSGFHLIGSIDVVRNGGGSTGVEVGGAMLFGLVGMLASRAVFPGEGTPPKDRFDLDLLTGLLMPSGWVGSQLPHDRVVVLCDYGPSTGKVTVSVSSEKNVRLDEDQYHRYSIPPSDAGDTIRVSASNGKKAMITLESDLRHTQVVRIRVGSNDEIHLHKHEAEDLLDKLKPQNEVK
jgi:hypothetical protein